MYGVHKSDERCQIYIFVEAGAENQKLDIPEKIIGREHLIFFATVCTKIK